MTREVPNLAPDPPDVTERSLCHVPTPRERGGRRWSLTSHRRGVYVFRRTSVSTSPGTSSGSGRRGHRSTPFTVGLSFLHTGPYAPGDLLGGRSASGSRHTTPDAEIPPPDTTLDPPDTTLDPLDARSKTKGWEGGSEV